MDVLVVKTIFQIFFNPMLFTNLLVQACYFGKTKRHLKTRTEEYLGKDKNLQILKHLNKNWHCRQVSFDVIVRNSSRFRLQIKEVMLITSKKQTNTWDFYYDFKQFLNVNSCLIIKFRYRSFFCHFKIMVH